MTQQQKQAFIKMKKYTYSLLILLSLFIALFILHLLAWPVPLQPAVWKAPVDQGYFGKHAKNKKLSNATKVSIGNFHGPEDIAISPTGEIYMSSESGEILKLSQLNSHPEVWVNTGGRPLGIDFSPNGNLIVADAYRGLLSISADKSVEVLSSKAEGVPFGFTDDLDVAENGKIYFSDASSKFSAEKFGTYEATVLDLLEQGSDGRLLEYDPSTQKTRVLVNGLQFANGVAISTKQDFLLFTETGRYRVSKYWLKGPQKGQVEVILDNLPAFPDNVTAGKGGRFWVALHAPRNQIVDSFASMPFMRKVIYRMPKLLQPKPVLYGHVIAINAHGDVLEDMQDPRGLVSKLTSAVEHQGKLYLGNLDYPFFHTIELQKEFNTTD